VTTQPQVRDQEGAARSDAVPEIRAPRIAGSVLMVPVVGMLLLLFAAAGAAALVFMSDLVSRWTGLPASHLLGAIIAVVGVLLMGMIVIAMLGGIRDAIHELTATCAELSEDAVVRRLARALEDADDWMETEAMPDRKRPRRRRRSA
jgi:multisubunit Na+/H+ antiporter MnhG subunit